MYRYVDLRILKCTSKANWSLKQALLPLIKRPDLLTSILLPKKFIPFTNSLLTKLVHRVILGLVERGEKERVEGFVLTKCRGVKAWFSRHPSAWGGLSLIRVTWVRECHAMRVEGTLLGLKRLQPILRYWRNLIWFNEPTRTFRYLNVSLLKPIRVK